MAGRKLTGLEIVFASKVFQGSISYISVQIYYKKYAFYQPDNSAMTPNGSIFIHGEIIEDYGSPITRPESKAFFIHEMVHVWQAQNGVLNPILSAIANSIRHGFDYNAAYEYTLDVEKDLLDYRMVQQAQIIEDWVRIKFLDLGSKYNYARNKPRYVQNEETGTHIVRLYESVLKKFISDPSYAKRE